MITQVYQTIYSIELLKTKGFDKGIVSCAWKYVKKSEKKITYQIDKLEQEETQPAFT